MVAALAANVPQMAPDLRFRLLVSPNATGRLSEAANVEQVVVRAAANGPGTMWWLPYAANLRGVALFHATFNIMPMDRHACGVSCHGNRQSHSPMSPRALTARKPYRLDVNQLLDGAAQSRAHRLCRCNQWQALLRPPSVTYTR